MLQELLERFEDPRKPFFGPNYWLLKTIGIILPKSKLGKIVYFTLHQVAVLFVISQYLELYVIRSNMDQVLINVKITMLSFICVVKVNTFLFWRTSWKEIIEYVTEADRYEREHRNSVQGKIIDSYTKYCRKVTYCYWLLVCATAASVIIAPLAKYFSSSSYRQAVEDGTELFTHIFSSWMPFEKNHSPGCWITVLWHIYICFYGSLAVGGYDSCVIVVMVFFGGKLELLRERCKQMLGSCGNGITDEEAVNVIREVHHMHVLLLKHSRLFNSLLSPVMFLYVVMCSLMLCASAFQLASSTDTIQKFLMAQYLIFGIAQLFVFCWHSNDVFAKFENVVLGPYESEWWNSTLQQRKCVLLLTGQLQLVHMYTAGPFTDLNLTTFVTV